MPDVVAINEKLRANLLANPEKTAVGRLAGVPFSARIGIPNYVSEIAGFYADLRVADPRVLSKEFNIPPIFEQFGIVCEFERPLELHMYDDDMVLDERVKELIRQFGPVILRNVYMKKDNREQGHKARFQQLNFHYDRAPYQDDQYSLYVRDPFDPEQKEPRGASTVFISNVVACMQYARQHRLDPFDEACLQNHYILYGSEDILPALGKVVLEQPWNAPSGQGEIIVIDNRTVFHASYYPNSLKKGWKIGVRYLK